MVLFTVGGLHCNAFIADSWVWEEALCGLAFFTPDDELGRLVPAVWGRTFWGKKSDGIIIRCWSKENDATDWALYLEMMNKLFNYHTDVYASSIKGYCLLHFIFIHPWLAGIQRFGFSQLDSWLRPGPYHLRTTRILSVTRFFIVSRFTNSKHGLKTLPDKNYSTFYAVILNQLIKD